MVTTNYEGLCPFCRMSAVRVETDSRGTPLVHCPACGARTSILDVHLIAGLRFVYRSHDDLGFDWISWIDEGIRQAEAIVAKLNARAARQRA